ncbi:MAG: patatin-like phospholipase family protein [Chromatiaceae bacterium]|jgi:predicted acylesterase/phospholipase RssA|nr:patatin-like phospholipase family protein [Chromatiaceae bacterium]
MKMKKYGFVASGGGYRSFYTEGALVWLRQNGISVSHIASTSSGNNITLDYLLWDHEKEELPPVLTQTLRLSVGDIFHVFKNFLGLRPSLIPNGSHMFTVDKGTCRKSLTLDEPARRETLIRSLESVQWDIFTTNLTKREARSFRINQILSEINTETLDRFMDVFLAGITTIPYFKAIEIGGDYYMEGGYMDNTPLRTMFEDPEVDEIIAVDFTDYDYHTELKKLYATQVFTLPLNSIDMLLLVSDIQLSLPNIKIFDQANRINRLLEEVGKTSIELDGKTYYRKPIHVLSPKNLESMTIALKDSTIQRKYFELGKDDMAELRNTRLK